MFVYSQNTLTINLDNVHLNHQLLMNEVKQLSSYGCELRLNNDIFWPASSSFSVTQFLIYALCMYILFQI